MTRRDHAPHAATAAVPEPPDDGVRDRTADPEVLARLLRLALRHLVTDLPAELRWTDADLLAAGRELDLRVTVTYGLGGPADDPVIVHLDRRAEPGPTP